MSTDVYFLSKVYKVKTRTKDNKDYYIYRMNIPKEESDKLQLSKDDYLFVKAAKAKWYHMLNWKEMYKTWNMMPQPLRNEIRQSGVHVPLELQTPPPPTASPTYYRADMTLGGSQQQSEQGTVSVSGLTNVVSSWK
jgi:hypothetical protein